MDQFISLVVGVFSGVVASLMVIASAWLFKNVLIPWYQGFVYKGVNLSGDWCRSWHLSDGTLLEAHYTLNHKGHRLFGSETTTRKPRNNGEVQRKTYDVEGQISDRLVMLTSRHRDPAKISGMVMLLEVVGDGTTMTGCTAYYSTNDSRIVAARVEMTRESSALVAEGVTLDRIQPDALSER